MTGQIIFEIRRGFQADYTRETLFSETRVVHVLPGGFALPVVGEEVFPAVSFEIPTKEGPIRADVFYTSNPSPDLSWLRSVPLRLQRGSGLPLGDQPDVLPLRLAMRKAVLLRETIFQRALDRITDGSLIAYLSYPNLVGEEGRGDGATGDDITQLLLHYPLLPGVRLTCSVQEGMQALTILASHLSEFRPLRLVLRVRRFPLVSLPRKSLKFDFRLAGADPPAIALADRAPAVLRLASTLEAGSELNPLQLAAGTAPPQYIRLGQMAAIVNRSTRTLEKLKGRKQNPLPPPAVEGGGGKPDEWLWEVVRPWLEVEYGRKLPERFPGAPFGDGRADRN